MSTILSTRFVNSDSREVYGRKANVVGWQLWLRNAPAGFTYAGFQYATLAHLVEDNPGSVECYGNILFIDPEQKAE